MAPKPQPQGKTESMTERSPSLAVNPDYYLRSGDLYFLVRYHKGFLFCSSDSSASVAISYIGSTHIFSYASLFFGAKSSSGRQSIREMDHYSRVIVERTRLFLMKTQRTLIASSGYSTTSKAILHSI